MQKPKLNRRYADRRITMGKGFVAALSLIISLTGMIIALAAYFKASDTYLDDDDYLYDPFDEDEDDEYYDVEVDADTDNVVKLGGEEPSEE
jgi:hypothetical protein